MQKHHDLTTPAAPNGIHAGLHAVRERLDPRAAQAWSPRAKKHVADLLDDAGALADWHRNLERLRQAEHG
ncbi:MAG: hypothetical protein KUL79_15585 [Thauera sp.]|nr:hypothetical protein [Thauera sp.]